MLDNITVVIPAHNEEKTIAKVVESVLRYTKNLIIVNDGSSDDTLKKISHYPITIINHEVNLGKSQSLYDGLKAAVAGQCDAVITMDADLQHSASDIPKLLQAYHETPGIIIGGRLRQLEQRPKRSIIGNNIADFFIAWATKQIIVDTQSGFRCYSAKFIKAALEKPIHYKSGFILETSLLVKAAELTYPIITVPIDAHYPKELRPSHYQPWKHTLPIVFMLTWYIICRGLILSGLFKSVKYFYKKYRRYKANIS